MSKYGVGPKYDNREVVKEIEKHPCLYDYNLPQYFDKALNMKTWQHIAAMFDTTVPELKERWKKLRTSFGRSIKHQALGKCHSSFYLVEEMSFVLPFMKRNTDQGTLDTSKIKTTDYEETSSLDNSNDIEQDDERTREDESEEDCSEDTKSFHKTVFVDLHEDIDKRAIKRPATYPLNNYAKMPKKMYNDSPRKMFVLSLLPDIEAMTDTEMSTFRKDVILSIDKIITARNSES